ncbi:hypothetical protein HBH56_042670 [Parastagonospora nodorum]|uniref:CMP/dCMP-type deaminase domain-containing protein n=1 Tax=Phaeosphaeria nodorum (strain SN15 / ATCC MYA-4574 / FGSC 10173) TaxID=321614 RepID=A0A7U2HV15_PHANO|nr:hypothetical protein HBH56_042670 [Parastagonospora nodorum]QRC92910.1 hypothetical protein JI435_080420 [Parastagonospora nodorum SN15]KAH3933282.1 hypothetical protein HBH54_070420 [Parastagonospora nodorum]KAH3943445.1 hypothetical protein HBH53_174600 [Parastagonospora nodorum]KAH4055661.1 hypothetical protein HBH49_062000 [Parastagonospora nodorum]
MRTDNYLNLCLDQAAKSPLRYRHGAIIVRGGKVIGQGYNDYRTGFDGGALKTGLLPLRSLDGSAIAELKKKKLKSRGHMIEVAVPAAAKTFTPFEMTTGGGKLANTPLSMHSEMMAIQSALSAASCAAFTAPGYDVRQSSYMSRQSASSPRSSTPSSLLFKSGDLNNLHLNRAALSLAFHDKEEKNVASSAENSMKKHQMKNEKTKYHHHHNIGNNGQHAHKRSQHAHKLSTKKNLDAIELSNASVKLKDVAIQPASKKNAHKASASPSQAKARTKSPPLPSQNESMLMPTGQTGRSTRDRTKLPRLHGADLYVARLGWTFQSSVNESVACCVDLDDGAQAESPPRPSTGSLHEELRNPDFEAKPAQKAPSRVDETEPSVHSSRPCYRCISFMASVGIKRVFWTTGFGTWESAKVRDLVDALDNLGLEQPSNAAATLSNVFVTKHEVLMLRRTMGDR